MINYKFKLTYESQWFFLNFIVKGKLLSLSANGKNLGLNNNCQ